MSDLRKGTVLGGRYRLKQHLGSGGMALVWLAEDEQLGRPVAVKIPSDVLAADPAFMARFEREARTAAGLSHPNLVPIYDFSTGSEHERPYLVMEYVEGPNLDQLAAKRKPVDAERLARDLLGALEHIHAAGIVHRDVKPSNVLMPPDGAARLTDFGIAQPEDATRITQTGQVIGTKGYIAPELMHGDAPTPRSDLYSAGMVLGDLLGDRAPFTLHDLVADLTDDDPRRRPRSAAKALAALDSASKRPTEETTPLTAPTRAMRNEPPTARRASSGPRPPALAALGLAALAVLGIGLALVLSDGGDQAPERASRDRTAAESNPAPTTPAEPEPTTTAAEPESADGAALNQQGFELLQSGDAEAAVPILEQAVASFGEGSDDIDYAYALFNLGRALRLSGRPDEAIPILERRAEIPNQRGIVKRELELARSEAAGGSEGDED